jgi:endonuclease/exonuclease/phosphatase family metal-dependent hydrolase
MNHRLILRLGLMLMPALGWAITSSHAETITAATYNIEVFHERFSATTKPTGDRELTHRLRADADKANWVTAQVILDPKFNPDVLVIEECCDQKELDAFNTQWLNKAYETVIVFPTNTERHQSLALMMKPGWKVLERRDQYYLEKDPGGGNERGDRLFARGPAFCLVQSPGGYQFWVGVTHQKSKSGNSVDVTKWRIRECARTHQILKELEHSGKGNGDVLFMGDMNDELGYQEFEQEAGGDAIAALVGPKEDGLVLETKPLIDAGQISYGGYWRPQHRGFIDHILCTKEMAGQVEEVKVFNSPLASVSSDHFPVYVRFHADPVPATQAAGR